MMSASWSTTPCTNLPERVTTTDDWDFAGLRRPLHRTGCACPDDFNYTKDQLEDLTKEGIADELI